MNTTTESKHKAGCPMPGYRYVATVRRTKETIANGKAGHVVMICKGAGCGATKFI